MLVGIFLTISLAAALGTCVLAGAFSGLAWLWLLPLTGVGTFLALVLGWFLLLVIMSTTADMKTKQDKESKFYRWVMQNTAAFLLQFLRVRVHTQGFEKKLPEGRFLLVCNHLHEVDPVILLSYFPKSQLAFIGKQEVKKMFVAGAFLKKTLGQFVDRGNDREALRAILECIRLIKEDSCSVAVFPEGYIKKDRLLRPFRAGVFKIAQKAKVPIVVCTLQDTHKALKSIKKLKGADVKLHLVDVIPAEELEGVTAVDVANRVYNLMAQDLGPDLVYPLENAENT